MTHDTVLPDGHLISDNPTRLDMQAIHALLAGTSWACDRPRHLTERSFAHCLGFGLYTPDGAQIGCARVLTDHTFRAHLADLVIHPAARGHGLGKALVATILSHPALATVTHWTLTTADAHGLYRRHGFVPSVADPDWMVLQPR